MAGSPKGVMVSFNSMMDKELYLLIKVDAINKGMRIREYIAKVLSDYALTLKKETSLSPPTEQ